MVSINRITWVRIPSSAWAACVQSATHAYAMHTQYKNFSQGNLALVHKQSVLCISCTVAGSYAIKWDCGRVARATAGKKSKKKAEHHEKLNNQIFLPDLRNPRTIFAPLFGKVGKENKHSTDQNSPSRTKANWSHCVPQNNWPNACRRS